MAKINRNDAILASRKTRRIVRLSINEVSAIDLDSAGKETTASANESAIPGENNRITNPTSPANALLMKKAAQRISRFAVTDAKKTARTTSRQLFKISIARLMAILDISAVKFLEYNAT